MTVILFLFALIGASIGVIVLFWGVGWIVCTLVYESPVVGWTLVAFALMVWSVWGICYIISSVPVGIIR